MEKHCLSIFAYLFIFSIFSIYKVCLNFKIKLPVNFKTAVVVFSSMLLLYIYVHMVCIVV